MNSHLKSFVYFVGMLILLANSIGFPLTTLAENQTIPSKNEKTVILSVSNMTCAVCPITVKKSLKEVIGVSRVSVDFKEKTAIVMFDSQKTSEEALLQATKNAGYPATIKNGK